MSKRSKIFTKTFGKSSSLIKNKTVKEKENIIIKMKGYDEKLEHNNIDITNNIKEDTIASFSLTDRNILGIY